MRALNKILVIGSSSIIGIIVIIGALWLWVLAAENPLDHSLAKQVGWPIVCSTRGCITTATWKTLHNAQVRFAQTAKTTEPTLKQSLTTTVRQYLVTHGSVNTLVTTEEISRYRDDVLNLREEERVLETTGLTLAEYEHYVLEPYLTQEALRQQRRAENEVELFQQLAGERWLVVLPFNFSWNRDQAIIE